MLPTFYIIGERKCGTSSLFRYICNHPNVAPGRLKEPNFFKNSTSYIQSHWDDYMANFPKYGEMSHTLSWPELNESGQLYEEQITFPVAEHMITGESSANTLVDVPPSRLHQFLPELRLIIILREPVARTYSHYRMFQRFAEEGRPLGFELLPFEEMIAWEIREITAGNQTPTVFPSLYIQHLKPWIETFGRESIHITFLEQLINHTEEVMQAVFEHIGLPAFVQKRYVKYNVAPPDQIPPSVEDQLKTFFKTHNEALFRFLGIENVWASY